MNVINKTIIVIINAVGGFVFTVFIFTWFSGIDPKIIFKAALEHQAANVILAHNHPSGNLKPSNQDISLTKKMKEGGKLLDIGVLDHVIFADRGYFSFADEGLL